MKGKNPVFNDSGCKDLTAYYAINNVTIQERESVKHAQSLIRIVKMLLDISDFELIGRIQIRDKQTGKEFK